MVRHSFLLGLVAALLAVPGVSFGSVRIGEAADHPDSGLFAGLYCATGTSDTFATLQAPFPVQITSPIDGVVVQWRLRQYSSALTATFRVLHPGAPGQFTGAGTSSQTAPFTGLGVFATRLAIAAGDYIGVDLPCSVSPPHQTFTELNYPGGGANVGEFTPALTDGGPLHAPAYNDTNYTALLDATIEPDADKDGYGDETQDGCPTEAITHGSCITTPPPVTDMQPPKARAFFKSHDGLHHVVSHGLRGTVRSNEVGSAAAVAFISGRAAHQLHIAKLVKVARGKQTIPSAGSWSIRLKFKKSYRHRLHKASRLVVKVRVVVKDQAGNATVVNRKVILKG